MILRRSTAAVLFASMTFLAAASQEPKSDSVHGTLVVWIIAPPTRPGSNLQAINDLHHATPLTYQEHDAGTFGQTSGSFGQSSGSYGTSSDTASISTPKAAQGADAPAAAPNGLGYQEQDGGTFGQTSSSYGTASSNHGQTSGSYGQTASTYGTAASNHGTDLNNLGKPASTTGSTGRAKSATGTRELQFEGAVQTLFPHLEVQFLEVPENELKDMLTVVKGTANYPDLLLGQLPNSWGAEERAEIVLSRILPAASFADGLTASNVVTKFTFMPMLSITARAPRMDLAKLLVEWMGTGGGWCGSCSIDRFSDKERPAARVAVQAVNTLLRGEGLGSIADADMAPFPSQLGQTLLATSRGAYVDPSNAQARVMSVVLNGGLAVVAVSVVVSSSDAFGVANPLVIERRLASGEWRVLQVSLNMPGEQIQDMSDAMRRTAPTATAERAGGVMGVVLASPTDGSVGSIAPDLAWDNGGGAGLQVVEWQYPYKGGWSDTRLFLVPDMGSTLRTRVGADFATLPLTYRWRVWSIGALGATKISPWRTFTIGR